ncbi:MAG: penicillin-binding protein activator [Myxococcaceae bacterium]
MTPRALVLLVAGGSVVFGCVPSATVRPDGDGTVFERPRVKARQDPAADQALERANQTAEVSNKQQAVDAYLSVRKAYPETTAAQEALYQAGVLFFESGDYVNARKSFNELLFDNPLFDKADDAKLKLGAAALELRAYRDAYQTLSSIIDKAEPAQKTALAEQAIRAAEGAQLYAEALRLALRLNEFATTRDEQQNALLRVTDLVEGRAPFIDVATVQRELPVTHPAWPVLTFKLARIFYHLRDWTRLEETLNIFLREAPNHAFAAQAQEMQARANRRTTVKPKTLGVVLPMSGKYKQFGETVMRGIQLALKNSDIEVIVKDSQGDVNLAGKAVEELAFDDGAMAILGPLLADDSKRAALVAEELQVPILTLSRAEGITDIGPHVFRNMLTQSAQAKALADYATRVLGYKNFGVLYPNIAYGVELANEFWDEVATRGGTMRAAESYEYDQTTFTTEVKKLVGRYYLDDRADYLEKYREIQSGPGDAFRKRKAIEKIRSQLDPVVDFDALFIPDEWRRVSLVAPALAVEDIITNSCDKKDVDKIRKTTGRKEIKTVTLLGSNQWGTSPKGQSGLPELLERGGKFVICSIYVDGFFVDSARPATKRFVNAYRDAYKGQGNRDPILLEATGYDSALMIKNILDKQRPASREAFREALATMRKFEGATGPTTFNEKREAEKPLFFLTIDGKGIKELSPNARPPGFVGGMP